MNGKNFSTLFGILLVASFIATACAPATVAPTATQISTATAVPSPTVAPTATALVATTPAPVDPLSLNGMTGTVSVNGGYVTIQTDQVVTTLPAITWNISHPVRNSGLTGKELNFIHEGEEVNGELLVEVDGNGTYRVTVAQALDYFEDLTTEDHEVMDAAQSIANGSIFDLSPVHVEVDNYESELLRLTDDDDPFSFSADEACRIIKETEWIWVNGYIPEQCEYNREDPFVSYDEWKAQYGVEEYTLPTGQSLLVIFNQPERIDGDLWCSSVPGGVSALQDRDYARAHNDGHLFYSALTLYFNDGSMIPVPIYGWIAVGPNINTLDSTTEWDLDLYQIYQVGNYELTCN